MDRKHLGHSGVVTTIVDDGPKWRTITVLALAVGIIGACLLVAAMTLNALHLDQRAAMALESARQVGDATRYYKILFWIVAWIDMAGMITAVAVSLSLILGARAWRAVRDALEPGYIPARATIPAARPKPAGQQIEEGAHSMGRLPADDFLRMRWNEEINHEDR